MSEEEIAIETLKEVASDDFDTLGDEISPKMAQNILNVIDKQKEEIEVLKEDLDKKVKALDIAMSNPDYICKDKIREILKDLEEFDTNFFNASTLKEATKKSLNDLLEEN